MLDAPSLTVNFYSRFYWGEALVGAISAALSVYAQRHPDAEPQRLEIPGGIKLGLSSSFPQHCLLVKPVGSSECWSDGRRRTYSAFEIIRHDLWVNAPQAPVRSHQQVRLTRQAMELLADHITLELRSTASGVITPQT